MSLVCSLVGLIDFTQKVIYEFSELIMYAASDYNILPILIISR